MPDCYILLHAFILFWDDVEILAEFGYITPIKNNKC